MATTGKGDDRQYGEFHPWDAAEFERLDRQSRAITGIIGHDFLTDIAQLSRNAATFRAIEVGCGTGLRTAVLASESHSGDSKIYGLDLSPTPARHPQPNTVEFVQGDILNLAGKDGRFQQGTFDFITSRMLASAITDWKNYIKICFDLLKPGGRIELQDNAARWFDAEGNEISKDWTWLRVVYKAMPKVSLDLVAPEIFPQLLSECGFVDVETKVFKWHISKEDDEEIAQYTATVLNKMFVNVVAKLVEKAGMGRPEDLEGLEDLEDLKDNYRATAGGAAKGTYCNFRVVLGRKP